MSVERVEHQSALEFLDAIAPFSKAENEHLSYRGHADATWKLDPTAYRKDERGQTLPTLERFAYGSDLLVGSRLDLEMLLLVQFIARADQAGLYVPHARYFSALWANRWALHGERWLQQLAKEWFTNLTDEEELDSLGPQPAWAVPVVARREAIEIAFALAQHHGMPTRLLDWSRSPFVAAAFAASCAVREQQRALEAKQPPPGKSLSVWVANLDYLAFQRSTDRQSQHRVRVVRAPAFDNANLRVQSGLFSLVTGEDPPALDDLVANDSGTTGSMLTEHRLSWTHAPALLHHLICVHGLSDAYLYPGYDGLVRSLRQRAELDEVRENYPFKKPPPRRAP